MLAQVKNSLNSCISGIYSKKTTSPHKVYDIYVVFRSFQKKSCDRKRFFNKVEHLLNFQIPSSSRSAFVSNVSLQQLASIEEFAAEMSTEMGKKEETKMEEEQQTV